MVNMNHILFQYGTFAHFTLALAYIIYNENMQKITRKNIVKITSVVTLLYLMGHTSIFIAMFKRINTDNIGKIEPTLFGAVGHTCLLLFGILFFYLPKSSRNFDVVWNKEIYSVRNIIFILGQIGMFYTYIQEHMYNKNKKNTHKKPTYSRIISIVTFLMLAYFYLTKVHVAHSHQSHMFILLGLFLVGILYLLFFIKNLHELLHDK